MGVQAEETLVLPSLDDFVNYLRANTRVFMEVDGSTYYLTHTDGYWRAQDCAVFNDKGHFTDCSELSDTLNAFLGLPWCKGETLEDVFDRSVFYRSIQ